MATPFLPVAARERVRLAALPGAIGTRERGTWAAYRRVVPSHHDGPVSRVEFSPAEPHEAAVTAGTAVALLDAGTSAVRRRVSRFKDIARGGSYKPDGRLLVAGGDDGIVQVFDLASRAILRSFKGHKGAVHSTRFASDGLRVLSGGDDATVKVWDVPTSRLLTTLTDSTDYVRCQSPSPASPHVWAVGSYDGHMRIYDLRTRARIFDLAHGAQVDDVHLLPGGGLALSVGGADARVWDLLGGGAPVTTLGSHGKAVTCAAMRADGRLFTGGLDGAVKVHDVATWAVAHTYFYGAQVLSVSASADGGRVAAGLVDGTCVVRHKDSGAAAAAAKAAAKAAKAGAVVSARRPGAPRPSTTGIAGMESDSDDESDDGGGDGVRADLTALPNFLAPTKSPFTQTPFAGWGRAVDPAAGRARPPGRGRRPNKRTGASALPDDGALVGGGLVPPRVRLAPHDVALKRFDWRGALDLALSSGRVATAVGVLEELSVTGHLRTALEGRDEQQLRPLLGLLSSQLRVPEYVGLMVEVAHVVLGMYGERLGSAPLNALRKAVDREVRVLRDVEECLGMCQLMLGRP